MQPGDSAEHLAFVQQERDQLQARVVTLEQTIASGVLSSDNLLSQLFESMPLLVFVKDVQGRHVALSRYYQRIFNHQPEDLIGKTDLELGTSPDDAARYAAEDAEVLASGKTNQLTFTTELADGLHTFLSYKFPLYDRSGQGQGVAGVSLDITAQVRAEQERTLLQEQVIAGQREVLRELSTPLIPLSDGVVLMPLVGRIDDLRSTQIMEVLLEGIAAHQADHAILDISGVRMVDTQVADALLRTARAASLLGTEVILTGISAEVAQTVVTLGFNMSGIRTVATLREALREVLQE